MRELNRRALLTGGVGLAALYGTSSPAQTTWGNWGGAPYATSFADATSEAKFNFALKELGVPEEMRQAFKDLVRANPNPPSTYLVPTQVLNGMMSGGKTPHVMRNVIVGKTVIARGIVQAAEAKEWRLPWQGRIVRLVLPTICFNWSLIIEGAVQEDCVQLVFNAPVGGKVRWGVGTLRGPLAPSSCNAIRQGEGPWKSWYGECDICKPAIGYISRTLRGNAQVPHRFLYEVTATKQTIRFSTEVWTKVVYICLDLPDGRQTCGVYMTPEEWKGRHVVVIPDSLWRLDDGTCPS